KLLLEAKIAVRHGDWSDWLAANCRVSERSAQLYMHLAREFPQGLADMSLTGAIKLLADLKPPEEKARSGLRQKSKRDPVAEAIKDRPLAILQKAWDVAEENERNIFLSKIGAKAN